MKRFDSEMGHAPEVDPQDLVDIDPNAVVGSEKQVLDVDPRQVIDFIDQWLAENAVTSDSRVVDFALDIRNMVSAVEVPLRQPVGAGV